MVSPTCASTACCSGVEPWKVSSGRTSIVSATAGAAAESVSASARAARRIAQFRLLSTILPAEIQGIIPRSFSPTFSIWCSSFIRRVALK